MDKSILTDGNRVGVLPSDGAVDPLIENLVGLPGYIAYVNDQADRHFYEISLEQ